MGSAPEKEWQHKDEWKKTDQTTYTVVVSQHIQTRESWDHRGPYRWCVYAYIYPKHPHFAAFRGNSMSQKAATILPLHGGPTLLRWHTNNKGRRCSVQVGADYNHAGDEGYTHRGFEKRVPGIFHDADKLVAWLEARKEADCGNGKKAV